MSKRTKLFAVGILVTPLLGLLLWTNWANESFACIGISLLFPYAALEIFLENAFIIPHSESGIRYVGIFLAAIQFPIYVWLLGGGWDRKKWKVKAAVLFVCHLVVGLAHLRAVSR